MSYQQANGPPPAYGGADVYGGGQLPPASPGEAEKFSTQNRFKEEGPKYQDLWCAILFAVHLVLIIVILMAADKQESTDNNKPINGTDTGFNLTPEQTVKVEFTTFGMCGVAVGMGLVWFAIAQAFAKQLVWFTMLAGCFITGLLALVFLMQGVIGAAVVMMLLFGLNLLFVYFARRRIPFAVAMLQTSVSLTKKYPATIGVSFLQLLVLFLYSFFFGWTFMQANNFKNEDSRSIMSLVLVFSFFWCTQVISNVVHVTSCGTFSTWYFLSNTAQMLVNPTQKALKRTMTTSFGSVCFGSLLIALMKTIRYVVQSMQRNTDNAFVVCCVNCILACIENLLEYFTKYAFVQVAIYGVDFITAGKRTWRLTKERGVDALINDSLIGPVLGLGCAIGGLVTCAAGFFMAKAQDLPFEWQIIMAILGFIIGLVFVSLMVTVVDSCVATIFVCYAEDPQPLANNNPELYRLLESTYTNGRTDGFARV